MATDFELTRNEIVRAAYEDCRVAIDGEELSAEQLTKGIKKLNAILKHLQAVTYGEITTRIAEQQGIKRMSAQAAGGAVDHKPVSLIIPCHMAIGSDDNLAGYVGGIPLKTKLLRLEKIIC